MRHRVFTYILNLASSFSITLPPCLPVHPAVALASPCIPH